jgi:hypothetical protein
MWWWVSAATVIVVLIGAYLTWLAGRVGRLHRRAETAAAALDATLVRRAAAAAVLAEQLTGVATREAADLYAAARAALDAVPAEREGAENDLTQVLRHLPARLTGPPDAPPDRPLDRPLGRSIDRPAGRSLDGPAQWSAQVPAVLLPAWPDMVTASRRVGLARQVHTDVVRDALALRRRIPVRLFRLARGCRAPAYFDVDDPDLDDHTDAVAA